MYQPIAVHFTCGVLGARMEVSSYQPVSSAYTLCRLKFPDFEPHKATAVEVSRLSVAQTSRLPGRFFCGRHRRFRHTSENKCSPVIPLIFSPTDRRLFSVSGGCRFRRVYPQCHYTVTGQEHRCCDENQNAFAVGIRVCQSVQVLFFVLMPITSFLWLVCQPGITTSVSEL